MRNILLFATILAVALIGVPRPADAQVTTQFVNAQTGTTYTIKQTDCSKLVTFANNSAVAVTLPQAGTAGQFFNGCFFNVANNGAGAVTITPTTSTIGGASTLVLNPNQSARILSDSTNYKVTGGLGIAKTAIPTIASGACGASTNGAVVAGSTNHDGAITIGATSTTTCTMVFSSAQGVAPAACIFFPANATAAAQGTTLAYVSSITTAQVVLTGASTTLASNNYYYHCS